MDIDTIIFKINSYEIVNKENAEVIIISNNNLQIIIDKLNKLLIGIKFDKNNKNLKICGIRLFGSDNLTDDEIFVR